MLTLLLFPLVLVVSAEECPAPTGVSDKVHQELLQSQLQFSADLLQTIGNDTPSKNVFFSPSSVYNALLITYFSTGGLTENSLKKTLRIPENQVKSVVMEEYFQVKNKSKEDNRNISVSSANRIYISNELKLKGCMHQLFSDEIRTANFIGDPVGTVREINSWVAEHTRNMIPKLLSNNDLSSATKAAIVNAAYFKGKWKTEFDKDKTREDKFHKADGTTVPVTMMYMSFDPAIYYDEQLEATILELPYDGDDVSMFILLPEKRSEHAISILLNKLKGQTLHNIFETTSQKAAYFNTDVYIPKFSAELEYDLIDILKPMGAEALFNGLADFSPLLGMKDLKITKAIHKSKLKVDEVGTEAAAATAFLFETDSASVEVLHREFRADHPFIYAIYEKSSKILWFAGIYNSP